MHGRFKVVCIPCKALYKCSALLFGFTLLYFMSFVHPFYRAAEAIRGLAMRILSVRRLSVCLTDKRVNCDDFYTLREVI